MTRLIGSIYKFIRSFTKFFSSDNSTIWVRKHLELVIVSIFVVIIFTDISGVDAYIHSLLCFPFAKIPDKVVCPDYYDIPFWSLFEVTGVFATAIIAIWVGIKSISQSNKQLEIEQTPHVVMKDHLQLAGSSHQHLHMVFVTNVGRGAALNVHVTSDPAGKVSAADGSNPHSKNIGSGANDSWAIDEGHVIVGLKKQGIQVSNSVVLEIPDENTCRDPHESEFKLFFWYEDQMGNKYKTISYIRHCGHFFKVMKNDKEKI